MSMDPYDESTIGPEEKLARFVMSGSHLRKQDSTVKPEAFIPHPYPDLSVTRHGALSSAQIWERGDGVALARDRPLLGRADTPTRVYLGLRLQIRPDPVEGNPQHAVVVGWPPEKARQKILALEIAANSPFLPR